MKGEESPSLQPRLNIVIANVAKQSLACFLAGSSATLSSGCSNAAPATPGLLRPPALIHKHPVLRQGTLNKLLRVWCTPVFFADSFNGFGIKHALIPQSISFVLELLSVVIRKNVLQFLQRFGILAIGKHF